MADSFQARAATVVVSEIAVGPIASLRLRKPSKDDLTGIGALIGAPLPSVPNQATDGSVRAIWTGPDAWLIIGEAPPNGAIEAAAPDAAAALCVNIGDGCCVFEVIGPSATELLAKGSSLDLHQALPSSDRSAMTLFAQVNAIIDRPSGLGGYRLIFEVSIRDYLHRWFSDAIVEFG